MSPFKPGSFPAFLYSQFLVTPTLDPSTSFAGQTVIVTGSNIGLGFSAAQQIAQRGASRIILAVRTVSKGETAAQQIRSSLPPSNSGAQIEAWPLDLSSYQSVKEFAARANQLDRLDLLLENAGVAMMGFELQEGDEATITTNVISTTLLAVLLLPKLRETAKKFSVVPHLTIVSSEVAFHSTFEERKAENIFETLADPKRGMAGRYEVSKLLQNFVVRELAERVSTDGGPFVIVNTVNPGFCQSALRRNVAGAGLKVFFFIMETIVQRKTAVGARTLVHGASAGKETHGQLLTDCAVHASPLDQGKWKEAAIKEGKSGDDLDEAKLRKRIWNELMMKLEKVEPGVSKLI